MVKNFSQSESHVMQFRRLEGRSLVLVALGMVLALAAVTVASFTLTGVSTLTPAEAAPSLYDLVHLYPSVNPNEDPSFYDWYWSFKREGINFLYQLREVSGKTNSGHTVAGAQWFATVYENYSWNCWYYYQKAGKPDYWREYYRRTLGGEMSEVPMVTSADLVDDFNHVYVDEPQPYENWPQVSDWTTARYWNMYDSFMDPIESICLVIPNGNGTLNVKFANDYGRHFPWWWDANNSPINPGVTPIWISGDILSNDGKNWLSGDIVVVVVSGDEQVSGDRKIISGDAFVYVEVLAREIAEDIRLEMEDEESYGITITPSTAQRIQPGEYLNATIRLRASDTDDYGSKTGYISFRQSASFDTGYTGWRESVNIPVVVANVYDGEASEEEAPDLLFDMLIFERVLSSDLVTYTKGNLVNRVQFSWDTSENVTKDLGRFYLMNTSSVYTLETRVTNRTGTRYRMQRYDIVNTESQSRYDTVNAKGNGAYRDILPHHWEYDLTPDLYGTLPVEIQLDPQSQIAPGLVTVYTTNIGAGYNTLDTTQGGTSASFQLYTFDGVIPRNLTLGYTCIEGWDGLVRGTPWVSNTSRVSVEPFSMNFSDNVSGTTEHNAYDEIAGYIGLPPKIVQGGGNVSPKEMSISSSAIDGFQLISDVTGVGEWEVTSQDEDGNVISRDQKAFAVQPVRVRFRIPRTTTLLSTNNRWDTLVEAAESGSARLVTEFAKFGTIWVRSENAVDKPTNLFTALGNRGYKPSDCISAFLYDDEMYLDVILFLSDAISPKEGKGPFCYVFSDDGVPYILLGDGLSDDKIEFIFYINSTGKNPEIPDDDEDNPGDPSDTSSDGGSGCASGVSALAMLLGVVAFVKQKNSY